MSQSESSSESTSSQNFRPFEQTQIEEIQIKTTYKHISTTVQKQISRFMHNAPPNEFLIQQTDYNYIFSLNVDYINNQKYSSLSINFQGDKRAEQHELSFFDLNGLSKLNNVTNVSVQEFNVDLSQLTGKVQCLSLLYCNVHNLFTNKFECEQMEIKVEIASDNSYDLQWINSSHVNNIRLEIYFTNPICYSKFKEFSKLKNLRKFNIISHIVDMSQLDLNTEHITFTDCSMLNQPTSKFQVNSLQFDRSEIYTSQLFGIQTKNLIFSNKFDGNQYSYYYNLPTTIDDVPDIENVEITNCIVKLKTFSQPKIKNLKLNGHQMDLISFKFFVYIQNLQIDNEPEYLKLYNVQLNQDRIVKTRNQNTIIQLKQKQLDHKNLIIFLKKISQQLLAQFSLINIGVE
ncbi:Hypothetical_protein [Hexamita inflata]|uniref:Hypothetical_protein n=1 Tax=Hexamita inflata TaxID=28002 RepID=A0AA86RW74_9EUKA|nr:Hypothetical protein HINF_LOCUS61345 [Hexamita inflata]